MNTTDLLKVKREILLMKLQAGRAEYTEPVVREKSLDRDEPRSATMRFIVRHPALCMWVVGECLPFVLTTLLGNAGERCAKALRADQRRAAD